MNAHGGIGAMPIVTDEAHQSSNAFGERIAPKSAHVLASFELDFSGWASGARAPSSN
jgi:hypothetical protein